MNKLLALGALVVALAAGGYVAYRATGRSDGANSPSSPSSPAPADTPQSDPNRQGGGAPAPGAPGTTASTPDAADAPPSRPSPPLTPVHWQNIADASLGGKVERVTSSSDEREWQPPNLIDNGAADIVCTPFCSWAAKDTTFPQDIVLSFYQRREARIGRVVLDTLTSVTRTVSPGLPHQVEIAVSTTSPVDNFETVASLELPPEWTEQAIDLHSTPARYLRVRILSAYGDTRVVLGEIRVFEADAAPSILADFPRNLALPALGGAIVSFTSDYPTYEVSRLIDRKPAAEWRSADDYLPQEFVFAFHDDAVALIDRMVLTTKTNLATTPRIVAVSTSMRSPVEGFDDVAKFTLKQSAADQSIPIGRKARFVKLRILETFGGGIFTGLGEVQLLEGSAPGYDSVLFRRDAGQVADAADQRPAAIDDAGARLEQEKNDQIAHANALALGGAIRGGIDPIGENDYFKISVPGPARSVLTMDVSARPNIRTSISLIGPSGAPMKRFDPAHAPASEASFSWVVDPGDFTLQVTQPPSSIVLVWDTSGSMERHVKHLQEAVDAFLDRVSPAEVVNLIRFSDGIEVLLPDFTSDRARLKKAAEGKFFADGATPFYDVMAKAMDLLDRRTGNRAIVVMTDGEDAGSTLLRSDFWERLEREGIRVYTIGIGDAGRYSLRLGTTPRRLLRHAAMATNGQAFFAERSADLLTFFQRISDELRALCTYRLKVTRSQAIGTIDVRATGERITTVAAPAQLELILDASGSMRRAAAGRTMIETAKAVMTDIIRALPDDMHVALRVYGHRLREGQPGACHDSELVFPFAKLDKPQLLARIRTVQALGTTPIAYTLQQVASDMPGPGEKMIVLVTDGKEECGGDPAAAVKQVMAAGIRMKLNVVGFALANESLKAELRTLAALTTGQFVEAKDAGSLRSAIEQSFALPFDVLDAAGTKVAEGTAGHDPVQVPEGVYTVRVRADKPIDVANVRVVARETTAVELKKEGREIGIRVTPHAARQAGATSPSKEFAAQGSRGLAGRPPPALTLALPGRAIDRTLARLLADAAERAAGASRLP